MKVRGTVTWIWGARIFLCTLLLAVGKVSLVAVPTVEEKPVALDSNKKVPTKIFAEIKYKKLARKGPGQWGAAKVSNEGKFLYQGFSARTPKENSVLKNAVGNLQGCSAPIAYSLPVEGWEYVYLQDDFSGCALNGFYKNGEHKFRGLIQAKDFPQGIDMIPGSNLCFVDMGPRVALISLDTEKILWKKKFDGMGWVRRNVSFSEAGGEKFIAWNGRKFDVPKTIVFDLAGKEVWVDSSHFMTVLGKGKTLYYSDQARDEKIPFGMIDLSSGSEIWKRSLKIDARLFEVLNGPKSRIEVSATDKLNGDFVLAVVFVAGPNGFFSNTSVQKFMERKGKLGLLARFSSSGEMISWMEVPAPPFNSEGAAPSLWKQGVLRASDNGRYLMVAGEPVRIYELYQ